jgi:hypothetical protein
VLGTLLDALAAAEWSVSSAAGRLGVSTAALVSFIRADEKAWARVNQMRHAVGLRPLVGD